MRLKPALIMLAAFLVVTGLLGYFVSNYRSPGTDEQIIAETKLQFENLFGHELKEIKIYTPELNTPLILKQVTNQKWTANGRLASLDAVEQLVARIISLEAAKGHPTREFGDYELDKPRYRVTFSAKGEEHSIDFGTDIPELARASQGVYTDPYTFQQKGMTKAVPYRYARVDGRNQVIFTKDDIVPLLKAPVATYYDRRLLFDENDQRVSAANALEIEKISFKREAGSVALVRTEDLSWRIAEPFDARANTMKFQSALDRLALLSAQPAEPIDHEPADISKYGLDKPTLVIDYETRRGMKIKIEFGKSESDGRIYARSSLRPAVLLVPDEVAHEMMNSDYRDPRLVPLEVQDVTDVTIEYPDRPIIKLTRRSDREEDWSFVQPVSGRVGIKAVRDLLKNFAGIKASGGKFEANLKVDSVLMTAKTFSAGQELNIQIVKSGSKLYARNMAENIAAPIDDREAAEMMPDVRALRSRKIFEGFDRWSAFEMSIAAGESKVVLKRGKRLKWDAAEPEGMVIDYAAPGDFLGLVDELQIEGWVENEASDLSKYGLDKPSAIVVVQIRPEQFNEYGEQQDYGNAEPRIFELHLGSRTPDGLRCYAKAKDEPNVYEVNAAILEHAELGELEFRDRVVLQFDMGSASRFAIEGGRTAYDILRSPSGEWMVTKPLPGLAEMVTLGEAIKEINGLFAQQFVKPSIAMGFDKPYRKVTVTAKLDGKPYTRTIIIGAPAPGPQGSRYAAIPEDKLTFILIGETLDRLDSEMLSASIVNIMASEISGFSIEHRDGTKAALKRSVRGWDITSHPEMTAHQDRPETVAAEAGWIEADGYLEYNDNNAAKYGLDKPLLAVTIEKKERAPITLKVGDPAKASDVPEGKGGKFYYATGGTQAIFLLSEKKVKALSLNVEDLAVRN